MLFCQLSGAKSLASFFKLQQRFYCTARSYSLLEDAEKYCTLRTKLEMQRAPSLGPLDKACLHLLRLEPPLKVSTLVLGLNALALDSHSNRYRSDIKELKMSGSIKVGKFTPDPVSSGVSERSGISSLLFTTSPSEGWMREFMETVSSAGGTPRWARRMSFLAE